MLHDKQTPIFVFFGAPGSGKGEQAKRLSSHFEIPHISSGDLLRNECKKKTPLGNYFNELIKKGHFPADKYVIDLITKRTNLPDCDRGFILDGVPRTLSQSIILDETFGGNYEFFFIQLFIEKSILLSRLLGRRICPGCAKTYHLKFLPPKTKDTCDACSTPLKARNDDNEEVISERLKIFNGKFAAILNYYKDQKNWIKISSEDTPENCFTDLLSKLNYKLDTLAKAT